MTTGFPVVSCAYRPAALIPMPCCPRLCFNRWNFEPYSSLAKIFGTWLRTIPGPLSCTATRYRPSPTSSTSTTKSGRMPASSQASRELSTASLIAVSRDLAGLSNPSKCLFLVKNSLTLISRCREAIISAVARRVGSFFVRLLLSGASLASSGE